MIFRIISEKTKIKSFSKVLKRKLDRNIEQIKNTFESTLAFIYDYGSKKDIEKVRSLNHDTYTQVSNEIKNIHELNRSISIIKYNIDFILSLNKPMSDLANIKIVPVPYSPTKMLQQLQTLTKLLELSSISLKKLPQTIHNFVSKINQNEFSASGFKSKDIESLEDFNHSVENIFQENIKETNNKEILFRDAYNSSKDLNELKNNINSELFHDSINKINIIPTLARNIDNAIKYLIEVSEHREFNTQDANIIVEDIEIIENYIHNIGIILKWVTDYIDVMVKQTNQIMEHVK